MRRLTYLAVFALLVMGAASPCHAEEPPTLMGLIVQWRYPEATISGATMSDAATLDEKGQRTVPSIQYKAVLTTADPLKQVVEYYQNKLTPPAPGDTNSDGEPRNDTGRSVTFHGDSENRPVAIHIIVVTTDTTSTTLVISRAESESETHIAWTQYRKL